MKKAFPVRAKCKLCSKKDAYLLFVAPNVHGRKVLGNNQFGVYECDDCNIVFTNIDVNRDYYRRYYPKDYYPKEPKNLLLKAMLNLISRFSFDRRLRLIGKFKPKGNKILEIGCAKGNFLSELPSIYEKHGVEINKTAVKYVKEYYPNIKVYSHKIDDPQFRCSEKFDIIVMWHVFEHLDDPHAFLKNLLKLLANDGVIIIELPNRDSLGFNFTKSSWFHLDTPRHLFFYNYSCLSKLLEKYKLQIDCYLGSPIDYCQDLSVSFYKKLASDELFGTKRAKPKNRSLVKEKIKPPKETSSLHLGGSSIKFFLIIFIAPAAMALRLIFSLFFPKIAEINTYIVKRKLY